MVDKTVKNTVECLEDRIFSTSRFQNNWKQFKSHEKFRIFNLWGRLFAYCLFVYSDSDYLHNFEESVTRYAGQ